MGWTFIGGEFVGCPLLPKETHTHLCILFLSSITVNTDYSCVDFVSQVIYSCLALVEPCVFIGLCFFSTFPFIPKVNPLHWFTQDCPVILHFSLAELLYFSTSNSVCFGQLVLRVLPSLLPPPPLLAILTFLSCLCSYTSPTTGQSKGKHRSNWRHILHSGFKSAVPALNVK